MLSNFLHVLWKLYTRAMKQSEYNCASASEVTLKGVGKINLFQNIGKWKLGL